LTGESIFYAWPYGHWAALGISPNNRIGTYWKTKTPKKTLFSAELVYQLPLWNLKKKKKILHELLSLLLS
jgi:hypothetical protein